LATTLAAWQFGKICTLPVDGALYAQTTLQLFGKLALLELLCLERKRAYRIGQFSFFHQMQAFIAAIAKLFWSITAVRMSRSTPAVSLHSRTVVKTAARPCKKYW
jgi:hypothetical protein